MNQNFEKRLLQQQKNICKPLPISTPPASPFTNRQFSSCHSLTKSPKSLSPATPDRYSDRFIPSRAGARWHIDFNTPLESNNEQKVDSNSEISQNHQQPTSSQANSTKNVRNENERDSTVYKCLLKNELLGAQIDRIEEESTGREKMVSCTSRNLFKYSLKMKRMSPADVSSPYSRSLVGNKSLQLLRSPRKPQRVVPKAPYKVLDAPDLQDDFYLNLLDWSSTDLLSVGLGSCVYLWNAVSGETTQLCDLDSDLDRITSVQWNPNGNLLAVGTHRGYVQIWDAAVRSRILVLDGHAARVGALAWNGEQLSSGSRDRSILQRDIRSRSVSNGENSDRKLTGHRQEVCGLKWSPDGAHLASGGNDNKLVIWSDRVPSALHSYSDHVAAVKAIAWSPHQHGLLASGGGTTDRCIRFWNVLANRPVFRVDTGSQVCNLAWSAHSNELVSTHGYSENQIVLWRYPAMMPVAKLTGHTYRVLYLATSPNGESIATGSGDETLRFWQVFSKAPVRRHTSVLNPFTHIR